MGLQHFDEETIDCGVVDRMTMVGWHNVWRWIGRISLDIC